MSGGILVVEDDESVAGVLLRVLGRLGACVEWVATGREAVARVAAGGIDLVVLDLGLPDLDGTDVCRAVRADGFAGRVLVLSARYGAEVPGLALAAGADDFMSKPFAVSELLATVRGLLDLQATGHVPT